MLLLRRNQDYIGWRLQDTSMNASSSALSILPGSPLLGEVSKDNKIRRLTLFYPVSGKGRISFFPGTWETYAHYEDGI